MGEKAPFGDKLYDVGHPRSVAARVDGGSEIGAVWDEERGWDKKSQD
jgi:hypothetical protein